MRTTAILFCSTTLVACSVGSDVPCSMRPTDPMCIDDGGGIDGSTGDGGPTGDAHVACNGTCMGSTPHCLVSGGNETCVGCTGPSDCSGSLGHCETTSHTCVACVTNGDCTTASAPVCGASHTCGPCTGDTDCMSLTTTPACNTTSGACVACTATNQSSCASGICLTSTSTCAPMGGTSNPCDACTHDTDCRAGQLCVPMMYHSTMVGSFCAWRVDAAGTGAPAGDCSNVRPMQGMTMLTSVDGTSAMVCTLRSTTCDALHNFSNHCSPATAPLASAACSSGTAGANMDGYCLTEGVTECTVGCTNNLDCPCTDVSCATMYLCGGAGGTNGLCNLSATCTYSASTHTCT